jgi:murein DD-endopeptidase MepM/ murein hydrolase activator NlpD
MAEIRRRNAPALLLGASLLALAACSDGFDLDLRDVSGGFDTTDATRLATEPRPTPDARGVITYPNFQVVVARRGETITDIARRLNLNADELATYNGIDGAVRLRQGEVIALPRLLPGSGPVAGTGEIDLASLASGALDRVDPSGPPRASGPVTTTAPAAAPQPGPEPTRHKVVRGETAYSIARLYNVSVRALADWNGLGTDLMVREGQYLLIPVATANQPRPAPEARDVTSAPGAGTLTPEPPSASQPLPDETEIVSAAPPPSPDLSSERSDASAPRLAMPVKGQIIRPYAKGKNEGIDIAAAAGTAVRAADDGTIAAITRDTDQVPILVVRHADNLLTVYANIQNIKLSKGDRVTRGQAIAEVRDSAPAFLHFEVRKGFESVDPVDYVN